MFLKMCAKLGSNAVFHPNPNWCDARWTWVHSMRVTYFKIPNWCLHRELMEVAGSLQTELVQAAADRGSLEQELAASRLAVERAERDGRQEASRLQAEVAALRQRLDRADADLMHSRRENLRLADQVASLEREVCPARNITGALWDLIWRHADDF